MELILQAGNRGDDKADDTSQRLLFRVSFYSFPSNDRKAKYRQWRRHDYEGQGSRLGEKSGWESGTGTTSGAILSEMDRV